MNEYLLITTDVGGYVRRPRRTELRVSCSGDRSSVQGAPAVTDHLGGQKCTLKKQKGRADCSERPFYNVNPRRRPTFPHSCPCSIIGPARLNFRVRDGNGCDPRYDHQETFRSSKLEVGSSKTPSANPKFKLFNLANEIFRPG
jgi:hypothetical protein